MDSHEEHVAALESSLDRIMRELDAAPGQLPKAAMQEARQHREEIIPRLIQAIEDATKAAAMGLCPINNLHFLALFMLAEFRAKQALPAILAAVSLPDDGPFELFGDAITECLSRILAELASARRDLIEEMIRRTDLDEYVHSAVARTYVFWVRDGLITRDQALEQLGTLLREAVANKDRQVAQGLIRALYELSPRELLGDIEAAYRARLVEDWGINLSDVHRSVSGGEAFMQERLDGYKPTGIPDAIAEVSGWCSYNQDDKPFSPPDSTVVDKIAEDEDDLASSEPIDLWEESEDELPDSRSTTIRNQGAQIARNAPCPCGSGLKYKKCCGRRQ